MGGFHIGLSLREYFAKMALSPECYEGTCKHANVKVG